MTERPRLAQREPRSLLPEQMGPQTVCTPAVPQRVQAWVLWEDGVEELVQGHAIAWTKRAPSWSSSESTGTLTCSCVASAPCVGVDLRDGWGRLSGFGVVSDHVAFPGCSGLGGELFGVSWVVADHACDHGCGSLEE